MSEFCVTVVEIGKVGRHPNADTLSITQVLGSYPCIFRTGQLGRVKLKMVGESYLLRKAA